MCLAKLGSSLLAVLILGMGGCAPAGSSACRGLVYKESGIDRKDFLPCAQAMVDELDRYYQELKVMSDQNLPMRQRQAAHQGCLASNARLTRLIRQAGGRDKLVDIAWYDASMNRLNYNIFNARDVYLMHCFYGPGQSPPLEVGTEDSSHVEARRELAELR